MGRVVQIDDFIKELQELRRKFGNTCVYIRDVSWGAVALNRQAEDEKEPKTKSDKLLSCQCLNFENAVLCHQWENGKCKPLAP